MTVNPGRKKLSPKQFKWVRDTFPDEFKKMSCVEIEVNKFNLSSRWRRSSRNLKNISDNIKVYGPDIGPIFDYLDENCVETYYPQLDDEQRRSSADNAKIKFYFTDETDAVGFSLMFI